MKVSKGSWQSDGFKVENNPSLFSKRIMLNLVCPSVWLSKRIRLQQAVILEKWKVWSVYSIRSFYSGHMPKTLIFLDFVRCFQDRLETAIKKAQMNYGKCVSPWVMSFIFPGQKSQNSCNASQLEAERSVFIKTLQDLQKEEFCSGKNHHVIWSLWLKIHFFCRTLQAVWIPRATGSNPLQQSHAELLGAKNDLAFQRQRWNLSSRHCVSSGLQLICQRNRWKPWTVCWLLRAQQSPQPLCLPGTDEVVSRPQNANYHLKLTCILVYLQSRRYIVICLHFKCV